MSPSARRFEHLRTHGLSYAAIIRGRIGALGFEPAGSAPDELAAFVQEQLQAWGKAFKDASSQPE